MRVFATTWTNVEPGVEVYLILAAAGVAIFFFWRWLFKKYIRSKTKRVITTWLVTIITTTIVYAGFIFAWILMIEYYPDRDFDKSGWMNNIDKRYEFSKNIIESKMLMGKSKSDVKSVLGDSGDKDIDNVWYYNLGYRPQLTGIDPDNLEIDFKDGKVTDVIQHKY